MSNKSFRIRTSVGDEPNVLNVKLEQSYDFFEILSLKLSQEDAYKLYSSNYGVVVGRVLANNAFGIPNAKVSIFIEVTDEDYINNEKNYLYPYFSTSSVNNDGVRYNLLPSEQIDACYQNVGTFPSKRFVLDNDTVLEIYDKYWKYTTVTNQSGDYMIFGVPSGDQKIHVDIDLSDIGVLSQRPRDMIYKGYNINQFESPNKFKQSTNLDSLSQIYTQNIGVSVYPFWGDEEETDGNIAVTRADIKIAYEFEPTCVFIGSIVTDSGSNAIGKNCTSTENNGRMDSLIAGEGTIEMIRKTINNTVEEFQIKGNRLIDGDGVWCYQIPMNLDYVKTDEFGNVVPTDDPTNGIPTRARVRFRFSLDDSPNDATGRKRCKILVPNNPRVDKIDGSEVNDGPNPIFTKTKEVDYEFGTATFDESYRDLYWNKVYTVKSYIPRMQATNSYKTREHSGIKKVNFYGDNNPFPYNNISIKLNFIFRLICVLTKVIIYVIATINVIISTIGELPCLVCKFLQGLGRVPLIKWIFKGLAKIFCSVVPGCIALNSDFCEDGTQKMTFYPGCIGCVWDEAQRQHEEEMKKLINEGRADEVSKASNDASSDSKLMVCIETELARDNEVTSFNFHNDWVNGVLYAPLWYRKITPKKRFLFGLIKIKAKDQWCDANRSYKKFSVYQPCDLKRASSSEDSYLNEFAENVTPYWKVLKSNNEECYDRKCHEELAGIGYNKGLIVTRETMLGQTVYYYASAYYDNSLKDVVLLYATDIVLLGSFNDCDMDGVPQFFKYLEPSTYKLPTPLVFTNTEITLNGDDIVYDSDTESTGCDWALHNTQDQCNVFDGGLFYGVGCSTIEVHAKSCVNLERICELSVSLDESYYVRDLNNSSDSDSAYSMLVADGFVSKDELQDDDSRSMFATMNYNNLRTEIDNEDGLYKYKFVTLYPNNFDGKLYEIMEQQQKNCNKTYRYNYNIEQFSRDYYKFRMGLQPFFYKTDDTKNLKSFPRYENSFYFYFGLKSGKTAIEKFNSEFYSSCENIEELPFDVKVLLTNSTWCGEDNGSIFLEIVNISTPYSIILNGITDGTFSREYIGITETNIFIGVEDEENYPGFKPIEEKDGKNGGLANGQYELIITDSNGNIVQQNITLSAKYINFNYDITPFKISNNILLDEYSSYSNVRNEKLKNQSVSEKIGGHIKIFDVYAGTTSLCPVDNNGILHGDCDRGYKIPMQKIVTSTTYNEEGKEVITEDYIEIQLTDDEIINGVLECDQGGVNYIVTLTEVCDNGNGVYDIETNNIFSSIILVNEPTPVKLYINDVDYEIIKNFKCGWRVNGTTLSQDPSNFCGWDKIGDIDNPYYNFGDEIENLPEEEKKAKKEEIITKVKDAFWIKCPNEYKTLKLYGITDYFPITYGIMYNEDVVEFDDNGNQQIIVDKEYIHTSAGTVSDILIPTLVSKDSDNKGSIVNNYAKLNADKKPYAVAMIDSNGTIVPIQADISLDGNSPRDLSKWFFVHFIDKIFSIEFVCWAGNKEPVYFEKEPENWPEISSTGYCGFIRGIVYNGVTNNKKMYTSDGFPRNWYDANFTEQTINNNRILIETISIINGEPDENAIPTKRRIVGNVGPQSDPFSFPYTFGNYETTAAIVPITTVELNIKGGSLECGIDETLYGGMYISANESINDCVTNNKILKVSARNGDTDNKIMYYTISAYNDTFPYPNHDYKNLYGRGAIYASGVTKDDILQQSKNDGIGDSTVTKINENNEEIVENTKGYGDTGNFINIHDTPVVYVVAITDNNCRTISPVYDFRNVSASICLCMEYEEADTDVELPVTPQPTGNTSGDTSGSTSGSTQEEGDAGDEEGTGEVTATTKVKKYRVKVTVEECQQWYIKNFECNVKFNCNYIEGNPFSSSADVEAGAIMGNQIIIDITETQFFQIMKENDNSFSDLIPYIPKDEDELIKKSTLEITDISGMVTICKLSYRNPPPIKS